MKVYFIGVFHKTSESEANLLKTACDIWPLTIGDWGPEYDLMEFIGKVLTEKTASGRRRTVGEDNYDCHCYVRDDNLAGVLIADKVYPMTDGYVALERMLDDFTKEYPSTMWNDLSEDKVVFPLNNHLLRLQTTVTHNSAWGGGYDIEREEFEPLVAGNMEYTSCLQNLRNTVQYRQRVSLNQPLLPTKSNQTVSELKDPFENGTCSGCVLS